MNIECPIEFFQAFQEKLFEFDQSADLDKTLSNSIHSKGLSAEEAITTHFRSRHLDISNLTPLNLRIGKIGKIWELANKFQDIYIMISDQDSEKLLLTNTEFYETCAGRVLFHSGINPRHFWVAGPKLALEIRNQAMK